MEKVSLNECAEIYCNTFEGGRIALEFLECYLFLMNFWGFIAVNDDCVWRSSEYV